MAEPTHQQEMRNTILDAAIHAFNEHGYARATMDAVAQQAGVSKGTLYNYFESKRDLFIRILDRISHEDEQGLQDMLVRSGSAAEKLETLLGQWSRRLPEYEEVGRLFLEFWAVAARDEREGPITQHLGQLRDRWVGALSGLIREGIRDGSFLPALDPDVAAQLILACYDGLNLQNVVNLIGSNLDQLSGSLKNAILRSLGCRLTEAGDPDVRQEKDSNE